MFFPATHADEWSLKATLYLQITGRERVFELVLGLVVLEEVSVLLAFLFVPLKSDFAGVPVMMGASFLSTIMAGSFNTFFFLILTMTMSPTWNVYLGGLCRFLCSVCLICLCAAK